MKVAVKDANILIDLVNGGLLEPALRLPYDFVTTDAVLFQLEVEAQWQAVRGFVEQGVIQTAHLTAAEVEELAGDPLLNRLGYADLEVLRVAARENGILLTGDLELREEAKRRRVPVHGLLWILDQLLEHKLLPPAVAAKRLRLVLGHGGRLPPDGVAQRLADWEK